MKILNFLYLYILIFEDGWSAHFSLSICCGGMFSVLHVAYAYFHSLRHHIYHTCWPQKFGLFQVNFCRHVHIAGFIVWLIGTRQSSCASGFNFYLDTILDLLDNVKSSTCSAKDIDISKFRSVHDLWFAFSFSCCEDMEIAVENFFICNR